MFRGFSRALAIVIVAGVVGVGTWLVSSKFGAHPEDAKDFGGLIASFVIIALIQFPLPREPETGNGGNCY